VNTSGELVVFFTIPKLLGSPELAGITTFVTSAIYCLFELFFGVDFTTVFYITGFVTGIFSGDISLGVFKLKAGAKVLFSILAKSYGFFASQSAFLLP